MSSAITMMLVTFAIMMVFVTRLGYWQKKEKRDAALLPCVAGVTGAALPVSMAL